MLQLPPPYVLRAAVSGELSLAVAIDDAAVELFARAGIVFNLTDDHPFVLGEHRRWERTLERGDLYFACHGAEPVGFFAIDMLGDVAYLEQLSVRPEHGRRGLGRALLESACERLGARGASDVWLTTYAHVPWNGPFYERCGFRVVAEAHCSPQLRRILEEQRAALPEPEQRVAMLRAQALRA